MPIKQPGRLWPSSIDDDDDDPTNPMGRTIIGAPPVRRPATMGYYTKIMVYLISKGLAKTADQWEQVIVLRVAADSLGIVQEDGK